MKKMKILTLFALENFNIPAQGIFFTLAMVLKKKKELIKRKSILLS